MAEYKLSYTGKEIDEKLGKIDKISVGDIKPTDEEVEIWINTSEEYDDSNSGSSVNITAESIVDALGYTPANETELTNKVNTSDLGSLAIKNEVSKTDLSPAVQTSLSKADSALQSYTETDPTVPAWAKASTKPSYTKSEVGLGNVDNVKQYSASNPPPYPVSSVNGKTGAVSLTASDVGARASTWMPTAANVGADASGTASSTMSAHNSSTSAHADIREAIQNLSNEKVDQSFLFDYAESNNYADMSTLQMGLLHTNGTVYTGDSYAAYRYLEAYIPVVEGDELSIQSDYNGVRYWSVNNNFPNEKSDFFMRVCAYDSNKNVLSSLGAQSISLDRVLKYNVPAGVAFVRVTLNYTKFVSVATNIAIVKNATGIVQYQEYGAIIPGTIKPEHMPNTQKESDVVFCAIPKTINIMVGKEFRLYYKNVLSQFTDRLWLGYTSGIVVKRYPEYLSITAAEAMTKSINWKIYDEGFNVMDSGTMQVVVTADTSKTSKVLVIGDSTVTQSNAISQKLLNCYGESGGNLTLLGTRGTAPALHEGRAGWTSTLYCTVASNSGVTNPFYNNGFDFAYYMAQQGYSGVDVVVIQLGINDIFSMTYENFNADTTLTNLGTMISSILSYDSDIKIIVDLISPPNGDGTSFTDTYNTTQIDYVYLVNTIRMSKAMIDHFDGNASITISPNNCVLDATTDINDGVHPNASGYAKLGQAIYETINGCVPANGGNEPEDNGELWDAGSRTAVTNTYKPATTDGTFSNNHYYYPAAYTGALADTITMSDVAVGENSLAFKSASGAYGIFVPFIGLDSTKTYRFTVNPTVAGFRVYLVNYDSDGKYLNNTLIVDKTTGLKTYDFTPTADYQQGFCFAALSATVNTLGTFTDLSLVEVTE